MYYSTRNRRRLTFETLMAMPSEPESEAFYTYEDGDDRVEVLNDTFTIVLSRDVRKNTRIAAAIALELAKTRPEDDVMYVNTYAGVALMKEAFAKALERSGMQPPPNPLLKKEGEFEKDWENVPPPFQGGGQGVVRDLTHPPLTPPAGGRGIQEEAPLPLAEGAGGGCREEPTHPPLTPPAGGRGIEEETTSSPERIRLTMRETIDQVEARGLKWVIGGDKCTLYGEGVTEEDKAWAARIEVYDPPEEVYDPYDDDDDEDIDDEDDETSEPDDEEFGREPSMLPNFFIHDVPFGTWNTQRLERDIEDRGRERNHTIVVLNSFEFASLGREAKARMAKELLELRSKLGLSILIFSHDPKRDIAAGLPSRGPLGILAANAGSVQRLNDPFEHLVRHRKGKFGNENASKYAGNAVIHEAQMRGGKLEGSKESREPYRKVPKFRSETERQIWFREQEAAPDYHVDPWLGRSEKTGRELAPLARSQRVKRYFLDHADYIFKKGEEPTEYELETETYEAKEREKLWVI